MKLPLQIVFRDLVPLPSLEPEIRRRAARLDQWTSDVMSCQVVVEAEGNRHHQGHLYEVKIIVRVPEQEIVVGDHHRNHDVMVALHGAFDAMDRQLEDHAWRLRGDVKKHPPVLRGHIVSLSDDGTGRILSEAGDDFHFDRSQLMHDDFDHLSVEQPVRFLAGVTRAGREARRVCAS
jgi:ribosomal subunit interface protein